MWFPLTENDDVPEGLLDARLLAFYDPDDQLTASMLVDLQSGNDERGVCGLPFTRQWKVNRYFRVSSATREGTDMHMSNGAFGLLTQVCRKDQFEPKVLAPFEDMECLIPVHYDEVLTTLFGPDYMTPPPVEQRVAKHLDL